MKSIISFLFTGLFCLPFSPNLKAQSAVPEVNWDRSLALSAVHQVDTRAVLKPLFQMARTGSDSELLDALSSIEQDPAMLSPVKDFLMFTFAIGLSDLDANTVGLDVLHFLANYEVKTRVSHIDHPRMDVPLFNVRAATVGVRSRWDRQQATIRAEDLLQEQTAQWISAYLAANHAERMGFVDALGFASTEQLNQLGWSALAHLDETAGALTQLEQVVSDYPDSPEAAKAKVLLRRIPEHSRKKWKVTDEEISP